MSSMIRRIQKSAEKLRPYQGRGDRLGVSNPEDKALIARLTREARRV